MSKNILQGYPMPPKDFYKVYVRSITYNQSQYIEDCLNGVAMQKTGFPFIHHVIDDCSTDGEQEVIKAWIERECDLETAEYYDNDICTITLAKNKSNPNCTLVAYFLKRNMYRERVEKEKLYTPWREVSPYEAICEGDDYWIATDKLQMQVGYLERHDECVLCYCDAKIVDNKSKEIYCRKVNRISGQCTKSLILVGNYIITAGVCYRLVYEKEFSDVRAKIPFPLMLGDKPNWIFLSTKGMFYCFPQKLVAYRKLAESASHNKDYGKAMKYSDNVRDINLYFNKLYNVGISERRICEDAQIHKIRSVVPMGWNVFQKEVFANIKKNPKLLLRFGLWKAIVIMVRAITQ